MSKIEIDEMTLSDLNQIASKLETEFDDFWNASILESELRNSLSKYIVAKTETEIVGFAGIIDTLEQFEITNIVVKKNFRNNGVGNALLAELIKLAQINNKDKIILEVNSTNLPAIKLYEKNGFKNIGFRKKYYKNTDDANIMALQLK